jgi:hypothetical protein
MRVLLAAIALTACAPAGPAPTSQLSSADLDAYPPRMICSVDGYEGLEFTLSSGEVLAPMPSGRRCDYEAYRRHLEVHGAPPYAQWRGMGYDEWLRRRGDRGA